MAIGIVSFAFVAVLGLLPAGLNTFRNAMDASVSSQIFQRVTNDAQQTDFDVLVATPSPATRYFDDQGNEILDAASQARAIYKVKTRVQNPTVLPGTTGTNGSLATVTIQIANNPGNIIMSTVTGGLWSTTSGIAVSTQSTMVSRNTGTSSN